MWGSESHDTGGLGKPMMTRRFGRSKTHDDTGLVLNKKPMMTETPQTAKIFFLKKKLDPEKFFLEFFFWGGLANPCHHGFWSNQTLACHTANPSPGPHSTPTRFPRTSPRVSWSPHPTPSTLPRYHRGFVAGFRNQTGSCHRGGRSNRGCRGGTWGSPGPGAHGGVGRWRGCHGGVVGGIWGFRCDTGGLGETHDDTEV